MLWLFQREVWIIPPRGFAVATTTQRHFHTVESPPQIVTAVSTLSNDKQLPLPPEFDDRNTNSTRSPVVPTERECPGA